MPESIGTAYVQIEPSFEGVTGKIESQFGGEGEKAGKSFGAGFGSVIGTVGKVAASAVAAGGAAVATLTKQAVSSFADYEQLVGGVETLFGAQYQSIEDFSKATKIPLEQAGHAWEEYQAREQRVLDNANNAYMTAGLSANDYMETVTSFAAALNASLGNNAWQSANYADQAITDMADNANKMGSSMESIQNAYMGFSKQNFTMLDNLKLGYGGTKEEMQRLLSDAEKLEGLKVGSLDMNNFADVVEAIHIVQENLGIAGTTAKEASSTISGSLATMQSAWSNLLTVIGTGDANAISDSIDKLVSSAETFGKNIMPVIERALQGISQLITKLAPEIAAALPNLIKNIAPELLKAAVDIIKSLGEGILKAIPDLLPVVTDLIVELCNMLISMAPELIKIGLDLIVQLALGIAQALPELIPTIVQTVLTIGEYLIDNADLLIDASIALILGLADGIIEALPVLIEKAPEVIIKFVQALIRNAPKILEAATTLIFKLVEGIVSMFGKIVQVGADLVKKVKEGWDDKVKEAKKWGSDMINNFISGIKEKWEHLKQTVKNVASTVKSYLGFSEPDEGPLSNFHTYAPDMMELYAQGIRQNAGLVKNALTDATSDIMSSGINVESVQSIQSSVSASNVAQSEDRIGRIESLLSEFIANFKQDIYLDTGALVGGTVAAYNTALGRIAVRGGSR